MKLFARRLSQPRITLRTACVMPLLLLLATSLALAPRATATAIATSSLELQSLTITPASGSVMFSPTAQSFAQAQNSLGELVMNSGNGTIASSTATVTWANAGGSANSISQTASVFANVDISNVVASASSVGRGSLFDFAFSITGTCGSPKFKNASVSDGSYRRRPVF